MLQVSNNDFKRQDSSPGREFAAGNFPVHSEWVSGGQRKLFMMVDKKEGESSPTASGQSSVVSQWENRSVVSEDNNDSIQRMKSLLDDTDRLIQKHLEDRELVANSQHIENQVSELYVSIRTSGGKEVVMVWRTSVVLSQSCSPCIFYLFSLCGHLIKVLLISGQLP